MTAPTETAPRTSVAVSLRQSLFSKKSLHGLAVAVIVGGATSVQSLISAGHLTWHALWFGIAGGIASAVAGWIIRNVGE